MKHDKTMRSKVVSTEKVFLKRKKTRKQFKSYSADFLSTLILILMLGITSTFILQDGKLSLSTEQKAVLNLFIIWIFSLFGGFFMQLLFMPPMIGMLISGIILRNFPSNSVAVSEHSNEIIRASSLAVIFTLSGLEIDIKAIKKSGLTAMKLTCIPSIVEALACGLMSNLVFQMPISLSLSLGFIIAAVSPAIVVVGMMKLQNLGYGIVKGIPSLVVAAASFDDVIAISGFSLFIEISTRSNGDEFAWSLFFGPLSIIFGVLIGFVNGKFLSITHIWDERWKRSAAITILNITIMLGMTSLHLSGAGALCSISTGVFASIFWRSTSPCISTFDERRPLVDETEADVSLIWNVVFEPLLFGVIGSSLDFQKIQKSVMKSIFVIIVGLCFRLLAAFCATSGGPFTIHERIFIAMSWIPKATVQAAMCTVPLAVIKAKMIGQENFEQYLIWGDQILSTAILSIFVTAPVGILSINYFGPRILECDGRSAETSENNTNSSPRQKKTKLELSEIESLHLYTNELDDALRRLALVVEETDVLCIVAEARKIILKCKAVVAIEE